MPDRVAAHFISPSVPRPPPRRRRGDGERECERHAHAFDEARRQNFVEKAWLDRFLLGVPKGGHLLDLGCGAGEPIASYLIDSGRELTGVDASEAMITLARTRFGRQRWIRGDMRHVMVDRRFRGVVAWDSVFHLRPEEQAEMVVKVAHWLVPGGTFLFNTGEELYHASLAPAEYRALFQELGLIEIAFVPDDRLTGGGAVGMAGVPGGMTSSVSRLYDRQRN